MCAKSIRAFLLTVCLFAFGAASSLAQGNFSVASSAATVADIGYTEPAGAIVLAVISGTTVSAPFIIKYPAPITNNAASEISISGTGGLTSIAASPTLDGANNTIMVNVPAGGTVGDKITISGVRVAIANLNITQVRASISSPAGGGNLIVAGQTNPVVVGGIAEPFSLDQSGSAPLSYAAGYAINAATAFMISANYLNAFTNTVGIGGQTLPTRIRIIPFPSLPEGMQITFNSLAPASTGAAFTTLSGNSETVPRADGSMDVVFQYASSTVSATADSFRFEATMTRPPTTGSGIIQFQAELMPIGLATPNQQYPSTDIPRYSERLVPDETELTTGSTELMFPFRIDADETYTGIAVTNPQNFQVKATLTAYDTNGTMIAGDNITNPVGIILPKNGQYAKVASEIFGTDFNRASSGTIRLVGKASGLKGFYMIGDQSGPKLDGDTADISSSRAWYMPVVFRQGKSPFDLLEIYNPGESATTINLQLLDANGVQLDSATETIPLRGLLLRDIREVFEVDFNSFQGGYVAAQSSLPVVFRNNFGDARESNVLSAQLPNSVVSFYVPHFASGGQYLTELTLVNTNDRLSSQLTLTLLDNSGAPISTAGNPAMIEIKSRAQLTRTIGALFPSLGPSLVTGSIRIDVEPSFVGPFPMGPGLIGAVRLAAVDGSASTTLPLALSPVSDCVYSHIAQGSGYFTGLAVVNPNEKAAGFTADVYRSDGTLVGSFASTLQPRAGFSKLIYELVPASAGQIGGYVRIRSEAPLVSIAIFGTSDVRSLSAIAPQIIQ